MFAFLRALLQRLRLKIAGPIAGRSGERSRRGVRSERAAAAHLKRLGHRIIARNVRTPAGEADLVTLDADGTVVVVEVRSRVGDDGFTPEASITPAKQARLAAVAEHLARRHASRRGTRPAIRIDVVAVQWRSEADKTPDIRHYPGAVRR